MISAQACPRLPLDTAVGLPAGIGRVRYELDLIVLRSLSIRDGTAQLRTGDVCRVDGHAGTVKLVRSAPTAATV